MNTSMVQIVAGVLMVIIIIFFIVRRKIKAAR